jgi:arsenate reductase (glutaredoxin)
MILDRESETDFQILTSMLSMACRILTENLYSARMGSLGVADMYKLFGIPNCNTVKSARTYLEEKQIPFEFVDFKKYTPTDKDIKNWAKDFGGLPVNKSGLTYKKHKDVFESLNDEQKLKFIQKNTSMIKRPILWDDKKVLAFGFSPELYSKIK